LKKENHVDKKRGIFISSLVINKYRLKGDLK